MTGPPGIGLQRPWSRHPRCCNNNNVRRPSSRKVRMATKLNLTSPWLVAVWPGMGHVALNAGYSLLAKLGMAVAAELEAAGLFDTAHVEVKGGGTQPPRRPRNRFFVWNDPRGERD